LAGRRPQRSQFFREAGFEVAKLIGLKCISPVATAHVGESELRKAIQAVDGLEIDAIVQVGTNLAMARLAPEAENWLGKPVVAINRRSIGTRCAAPESRTRLPAEDRCSSVTETQGIEEMNCQ
jgi:maleate cis-trans isomerase